jgi:hypothetical protein
MSHAVVYTTFPQECHKRINKEALRKEQARIKHAGFSNNRLELGSAAVGSRNSAELQTTFRIGVAITQILAFQPLEFT